LTEKALVFDACGCGHHEKKEGSSAFQKDENMSTLNGQIFLTRPKYGWI
jgi:DUF4097 and DUF4098 domain-containing protein YvlB